MQLFEQGVHLIEKLLTVTGVSDDGVDHLMMTVYHLFVLFFPLFFPFLGKMRSRDELVGDSSQCTNDNNNGLSLGLFLDNAF